MLGRRTAFVVWCGLQMDALREHQRRLLPSGRLFRLSPRDDKFLDLFRVEEIDTGEGHLLGRHMKRGDASKAVALIAYQPETHR